MTADNKIYNIFHQEQISKVRRLDFVAYAIENESSLICFTEACHLMLDEAKNESFQFDNTQECLRWWKEHRSEYVSREAETDDPNKASQPIPK